MMKGIILTIGIVWLLFVPGLGDEDARAQVPAPARSVASPTEFIYHLQRFAVAGTSPVMYLWAIKSPQNEAVRLDGIAFNSLASPSLHKWIKEWQHNSTVPIIYVADKSLDRKLDPATSKLLEQELHEFAQYCHSEGETFVIRPEQK